MTETDLLLVAMDFARNKEEIEKAYQDPEGILSPKLFHLDVRSYFQNDRNGVILKLYVGSHCTKEGFGFSE